MIVRLKISRCLLPESGKTNIWSMLWRASRARYMILVSVGFDNSPPKPLSSGLLKCLRRVSTFSSLFILYDSSFNKYPAGLLGFRDAARKPQRLLAPGLQGRRLFPPDGHAAWALVLILFSPQLFISFHVLRHLLAATKVVVYIGVHIRMFSR